MMLPLFRRQLRLLSYIDNSLPRPNSMDLFCAFIFEAISPLYFGVVSTRMHGGFQ